MFKFLKELKESMKEGIAEAHAEAAEEKRQESAGLVDHLGDVSHVERFGVALGAVYRDIATGAMRRRADDDPAVILMLFKLPDDEKADYAKLLERDFEVTDGPTAEAAIATMWRELDGGVDPDTGERQMTGYASRFDALDAANAWNDKAATGQADKQSQPVLELEACYGRGRHGGDAFRLAVLSHIIGGSCALDYLTKDAALAHIAPVNDRAVSLYDGWEEFGQSYRAGEKAWGFSNFVARKILDSEVDKLLAHPASPWNLIVWPMAPRPVSQAVH